MSGFCRFVIFFLFSGYLYGSDLVVNVDPNPVVLSDYVRVSVVSEFPITKATLLVGDQAFPLLRVTDQLFKVKIQSFLGLNSEKPSVEVVFHSSDVHVLAVDIDVTDVKMLRISDQKRVLDIKQVNDIHVDNSKLKIEELEDQLDLLDQKNKRLNDQIQRLKDNLENQEALALSQEDIKRQKAELLALQQVLKKETLAKQHSVLELKKTMALFNKRQLEFKQKQAALQSLELELEDQSQLLLDKKNKVETQDSILKKKAVLIRKEEKSLVNIKQKMEKEEKMVLKMKQDINRQKDALDKKNKWVVKKEKQLGSKMFSIEKKQKTLNNKEKNLTHLSDKITQEKHLLASISNKLDMKKQSLEDEKNTFYQEKSDKEKVIKKTTTYIKSLEKKMFKTVNNLAILEQNHLDKTVSIDKEKELLRLQWVDYDVEKEQLDHDYKGLQVLEHEIGVRTEVMKDLGSHIDGQLDQLYKQLEKTEQSKLHYESDMNDKVSYLNNLTKLIEKRANRMEYRNDMLMKKNKRLSDTIRTLKNPYYRYSFSPYMGIRIRDEYRSNYDEFGVKFSTFLRNGYSVSVAVGSASYMKRFDSENYNFAQSSVGQVSIAYLLNPNEKLGIYFSSLARRDITYASSPLFLGMGLQLKYHYSQRFSTFVGTTVSDSAYFSFGIEKYIIPAFYQSQDDLDKHDNSSYLLDEPKQDKHDLEDQSYISISEISPYYCFFPKEKAFVDVPKSWYQHSVNKLAFFGFFNLDDSNVFNPKKYLTYQDASYSLVWARFIDRVLLPKSLTVTFSLMADRDQSYLMSFYLLDATGKKVAVIEEDKEYHLGTHQVVIDPKAYSLQEGQYQVYCELYSNDVLKKKGIYHLGKSLVSQAYQEFVVNDVKSLVLLPDLEEEFRNDDEFPYLKKAIQLQWFNARYDDLNRLSDVPITRLDFIEVVGKFLLEEGARDRNIEVDLSYYSDLNLIPESKRQYLNEYVIELGYGGDHNKNLNPFQYVTRAEFSVILDRLLVWKEKLLKDKNIILDLDTVLVN